jgi:serpin B
VTGPPPDERLPDAAGSHTDTTVDDEAFRAVLDGTAGFAAAFYRELVDANPDANLLCSPTGFSLALAMTYAGARGETRTQIGDVLRFPDDESLHASFERLQRHLAGRDGETGPDEDAGTDDPTPFALSVVNALWGQADYPFEDDYRSLLAAHYDGGLREVDFRTPEDARGEINEWVAEGTGDRVDELLPEDALSVWTRFVLVNAVYFRAAWNSPFTDSRTESAQFTALDGQSHEVTMMEQDRHWRFAAVDGARAVDLPYADERTAMTVILPPEGDFESYERDFDAATLAGLRDEFSMRHGTVRLPRFEFESALELEDVLRAMGMVAPFEHSLADFGAMVEDAEDLVLDEVYHGASIDVDENGTEAAAASGAVGEALGFGVEKLAFVVDRPFLFAIRDRPTGAVLFLGRAVDPSGWE